MLDEVVGMRLPNGVNCDDKKESGGWRTVVEGVVALALFRSWGEGWCSRVNISCCVRTEIPKQTSKSLVGVVPTLDVGFDGKSEGVVRWTHRLGGRIAVLRRNKVGVRWVALRGRTWGG